MKAWSVLVVSAPFLLAACAEIYPDPYRQALEEGRREIEASRAGSETVNRDFAASMGRQMEELKAKERAAVELDSAPILTQEYADCIAAAKANDPRGVKAMRRSATPHGTCGAEWAGEQAARKEAANAARIEATQDYQLLHRLRTELMREPRWRGEFVDMWVLSCLVTSLEVQQVVLREDEEFRVRWINAWQAGEISRDDYDLVQMFLEGYFLPKAIAAFLIAQLEESARYYLPNGGIEGRRQVLRVEQHLIEAGRLAEVKRAADELLRSQYRTETYDSLRQQASSTWPSKVREQY